MNEVSFVIPVKTLTEKEKEYFAKALNSIKTMNNAESSEIIIVSPSDNISAIKKIVNAAKLKNEITYVENDEDTCMQTQINKGAMQCVTKYFSVLEIDDTYSDFWLDEAIKYDDENYSMLMPINQFVDENGTMATFGNEIAWSPGFANENELGVISNDTLNSFIDFNPSGALINTNDFIAVGMLKPSMKIAAWYEFMLRFTYMSKRIFVIPKIGYIHTIGREGSIMVNAKQEISKEEGAWLIDTAKQEYFFKNDRNKVFNNE